MKKLLLLAAAALLSGASASAQWAVVGAYSPSDWQFESSVIFTGEGDDLSCTIENFTTGFKIVDITNNNWDTQYGTILDVVPNQPYALIPKQGDTAPPDTEFRANIKSITNAIVKWNPSTAVMEIVADEANINIEYPTLYVTGNFNSWPSPSSGVALTQENGIYTALVDLGTSGDVSFKIAGDGWSPQFGGNLNITKDAAFRITQGNSAGDIKTSLTGTQTITFNINTMGLTFGDASLTEGDLTSSWIITGSFGDCGWTFEKAITLAGKGYEYSNTYSGNFSGEIKIIDIKNNNWDTSYGGGPIAPNVTNTLTYKGDNVSLAFLFNSFTNPTFAWNAALGTLAIDVEPEDVTLVSSLPTLYVTGSFNDWKVPGNDGSIEMTEENGVYTAEVDLGTDSTEDVEFKISTANWNNQIAGGVAVGTDATSISIGGSNLSNLYTSLTGTRTLTFDPKSMEMYFSVETGVEGIEAEADAAPVYYNLQGMKVENPANGIFIVKKGNTTSKTIIR